MRGYHCKNQSEPNNSNNDDSNNAKPQATPRNRLTTLTTQNLPVRSQNRQDDVTQLDSDPSDQEDAQRPDPDHDIQNAGDGGTGSPGNPLPTPPLATVPIPATREQDNLALVPDSREQDGSAAEIPVPATREEDHPDPIPDPREQDGTTPVATPDATHVPRNRNADPHVQVPSNRER